MLPFLATWRMNTDGLTVLFVEQEDIVQDSELWKKRLSAPVGPLPRPLVVSLIHKYDRVLWFVMYSVFFLFMNYSIRPPGAVTVSRYYKSRENNLPYSLISAFSYLPRLPPSPASNPAPPPTAGEHGVSLLCCFRGHVSAWKLAPVSEQHTATRHTVSPLGAGLYLQWPWILANKIPPHCDMCTPNSSWNKWQRARTRTHTHVTLCASGRW